MFISFISNMLGYNSKYHYEYESLLPVHIGEWPPLTPEQLNLLAPEFGIQILAQPVSKMRIIHEQKT
jgi:hypothetical protein